MLTKYTGLLFLALLAIGCSKKSDVGPTIPANSVQLSDNGQQVVFASSTAVMETNSLGLKQLTITAATTDNNHQISLSVSNPQSVEVPRTYAGNAAVSAYTVSLTDYYTACHSPNMGTRLYQFYSDNTTSPDFQVIIKTVDSASHTISGTFSGSYYLGCDNRKVTNGQFNLPYTIRP